MVTDQPSTKLLLGDETLPVVTPPALSDVEFDSTVHGIGLAAGRSSRYGSANKLVQPLDGKPVVTHAVSTLVESLLDSVTVVVGHEADRVRSDLPDVDVWMNESFAAGQGTSVREGTISAREANADAVVFALGDMSAVKPETVGKLLAAYERGDGSVLAAGYNGQRDNPVLFARSHSAALASCSGDVGGRPILQNAAAAAIVETDDAGVLYDIDRVSDREHLPR